MNQCPKAKGNNTYSWETIKGTCGRAIRCVQCKKTLGRIK